MFKIPEPTYRISKRTNHGKVLMADYIYVEAPYIKSIASLILLNDQLQKNEFYQLFNRLKMNLDEELKRYHLNKDKLCKSLVQALFNISYLERQLKKHKYLQCVYCGRNDLVITPFHQLQKSNTATVDHFHPISKEGDRFNEDNLYIACNKCNTKKASKIYSKDTLKYPLISK